MGLRLVRIAVLLVACAKPPAAPVAPSKELPTKVAVADAERVRPLEVLIDLPSARVFAVTPANALVAVAIDDGKVRWRAEFSPHVRRVQPLRVDEQGVLLGLTTDAVGRVTLFRRLVSTGAVIWERPLVLPPFVGPEMSFENRFDITTAKHGSSVSVCWAWSYHPAHGTPPPPGAPRDKTRTASGGVRIDGDDVVAEAKPSCEVGAVPAPGNLAALLGPQQFICSQAANADGRTFAALCTGTGARHLLWWKGAGPATVQPLKPPYGRVTLTPDALVSIRTAYPDRVEVRTPTDQGLLSLDAGFKEAEGNDEPRWYWLQEEALHRLPDGWLGVWRGQKTRLVRRLRSDLSEAWRVETLNIEGFLVGPP